MLKPEKSKHKMDEFIGVIPYSTIERVLEKRELKKFNKFMEGQTMALLREQNDLLRFLGNINDDTLYD